MKLKTIVTAFTLALIFGASAMAQKPNARPADCPRNEQCLADSSCQRFNKGKRPAAMCPFQGIELNKDQQAKLAELQKKCDKKGKRRGACPDEKCLKEIKKILTPDQYVTFLENIATQKGNRPGPRKGHSPRHHRQGNPNPQQ